jgi:hypothetical protein
VAEKRIRVPLVRGESAIPLAQPDQRLARGDYDGAPDSEPGDLGWGSKGFTLANPDGYKFTIAQE